MNTIRALRVLFVATLAWFTIFSVAAMAAEIVVGPGEQYQTISAALADANDGDTIRVKEGTYEEDIVIDKKIKLVSDERHKAVLVGTITVDVDEVEIDQFKILSPDGANDWIAIEVNENEDVSVIVSDTLIDGLDFNEAFGYYFEGMQQDNVLNLTHSGDITLSADVDATGVYIDSESAVDANVTGDVTVDAGFSGWGVSFDSSGGSSLVINGDLKITAGLEAIGITYIADGESVLNVTGDITATDGSFAEGIQIFAADGDDVQVSINSAITASGQQYASGIFSELGDRGDFNVAGVIDVTTTGDNASASGIYVVAGDDLNANISAGMTVNGGDGEEPSVTGVDIFAGDRASVNISGDVTATVSGEDGAAYGVYIELGEASNATVTGDVTVEAMGDGAYGTGIEFYASDGSSLVVIGDVDVTANGEAVGISATADGGQIVVDVTGNITAKDGWTATGVGIGGESSQVTIAGDVSVTGVALVEGISVWNTGQSILSVNGDLVVTSEVGRATGILFDAGDGSKLNVTGDITVSGTDLADAYGVYLVELGGDSTINLTGDVTVDGTLWADGITILAEDGDNVQVSIDSTIDVIGVTAASGVYADLGNHGNLNVDGVLNVEATNGVWHETYGIAAEAGDHFTANIGSEVTVKVDGDNALVRGVEINAGDHGVVDISGDVTVTAQGNDDDVYGVELNLGDHSASNITGHITVTAKNSSISGILLRAEKDGHLKVDGDVTVDGAEAEGIFALFDDNGEIDVDSTVRVTGKSYATGISAVFEDPVGPAKGNLSVNGLVSVKATDVDLNSYVEGIGAAAGHLFHAAIGADVEVNVTGADPNADALESL